MQVKSIAECSKGSILQYFRLPFSYNFPLQPWFCLFLSGRLRQVLLYVEYNMFVLTLKLVWQAPPSGKKCIIFQFISISGYKKKILLHLLIMTTGISLDPKLEFPVEKIFPKCKSVVGKNRDSKWWWLFILVTRY